jgi:predicted dienelactone hydrolase
MTRLLVLGLLVLVPRWCLAEEYKKSAGPHEIETLKLDWKDTNRDRAIPVKVYPPKGSGPFPVVIFSHGLGGSRDGYEYLGRHWSSHGYVSVHLQHLGSDESVWRGKSDVIGALMKSAADPANLVNRAADVHFAIDELTRLNKSDSPLKGKLDLDRIAMAGHSFGSVTTLAVAGEIFVTPTGREISNPEPRIKVAIPISPNGPKNRSNMARAFGSITIPTFHITGTKDESPIDPTVKPADRQLPFEYAVKSDRYLLVLDGADHMVFARAPRLASKKHDERVHDLVSMGTTAFLDSYLKHDARATAWLSEGLAKELGHDGTFQHKAAK